MLDNNPGLTKVPWFQNMLSQEASPEMKALLEKQWDIINSFYGLGVRGADTIGDVEEVDRVVKEGGWKRGAQTAPGMPGVHKIPSRSTGAPKAKPGAGKVKGTRVKMDREGNLL